MVNSADESIPATVADLKKLHKELSGLEDRLIQTIDPARVQVFKTDRHLTGKIEELRKQEDSPKAE